MASMGRVASLDALGRFVRRKGWIYPGSLLHGGLSGIYDHFSVGSQVREAIRRSWRTSCVRGGAHGPILASDTSCILSHDVVRASGHVAAFQQETKKCTSCGRLCDVDSAICTACGGGVATCPAQELSMLVHGHLGHDGRRVYWRPETTQACMMLVPDLARSHGLTLPFGVCSTGPSFRNELSPGPLTFRTREFQQLELAYAVDGRHASHAHDALKYWTRRCLDWLLGPLALSPERLRVHNVPPDDRAHYASQTLDIEFNFPPPLGWRELGGVANRGTFDAVQHGEAIGKPRTVPTSDGRTALPAIIEPSFGLDRIFLALLCEHMRVTEGHEGKVKTLLPPVLSPVAATILPLVKRSQQQRHVAQWVMHMCTPPTQSHTARTGDVEGVSALLSDVPSSRLAAPGPHLIYDEAKTIGKRYARYDSDGVPLCLTIDDQTCSEYDVHQGDAKHVTVAVRARDSGEQWRACVEQLPATIKASTVQWHQEEAVLRQPPPIIFGSA